MFAMQDYCLSMYRILFNALNGKRLYLIIPMVMMMGMISGCSIGGKIFSSKNEMKKIEKQKETTAEAGVLDSVVKTWLGVPYRYGGTMRSGVDCSGLVREIYKEVYQIELPRSTNDLLPIVQTVGEQNLQPGYLIFYEIEKEKEFHVGIYMGNRKFVHASSTKGVMISSMDKPYFQQRFFHLF